jgi:Galactose oxidase, central domain/Kelch motif
MRLRFMWFLLILAAYSSLPCAATRPSSSSSGSGSIVSAGQMSVARFDQSATVMPNGKVLIAGGMARNGVYHDTVELFDPATRQFIPAGRMSTARACHTATLLPDGKVLLAGGSGAPWIHLSTAELYDPATGRFLPTGHMTAERCGAEAALLPNGKVLIVGGLSSGPMTRLASAELYDPANGTFTATGSMHTPRDAQAVTLLRDGRVLVTGGSSSGRFPNETIEASAEIYDPATGRFKPTGNMLTPRYKHAAALLADGRVLIVGGSDNRDWRGKYASAEIYDPATGRFSVAGKMAYPRYKLRDGVVRLRDGRVLIAGGAERPELFDPASRMFREVTGSVGNCLHFSTTTLLSDGTVLIAGGYGEDPGAGGVATAWLYRP